MLDTPSAVSRRWVRFPETSGVPRGRQWPWGRLRSAAMMPSPPEHSSAVTVPRRKASSQTPASSRTAACHQLLSSRPSGIAAPAIAPMAVSPGLRTGTTARDHWPGGGPRCGPPLMTNMNDGRNAISAASSPPPIPACGVADDGDGQHHRAGSYLAQGNRIEELRPGHPVIRGDDRVLHQRDDHEAAA